MRLPFSISNLSAPWLIACGAVICLLLPLGAENSNVTDDLAPLVQTIAVQQKTIDENQAAIDKSLAVIQEDLRQAKIYVGRAGKAKASK